MPVGTSFENSAMKTSFSLSSLQASSDTPDKGVKPRQFNSLTKRRREVTWRRSWGSSASDQKDDFWSALQANYNYIMDNQLIDNCQEADGEIVATHTWSLEVFCKHFSELYSWLNSIQEAIYGNEDNITDKALRAHFMSAILKKSYIHKIFNDQACQLVQHHPESQEEVLWRVTHLNSKWESIESVLKSSDCGRCEQETCLDLDHEVKCLHTWIKNIETILQPVDFRVKWTKAEIEKKALEHKLLHSDIENHGKIVSSIVKLCQRTDASCNNFSARRIASNLEKRWHLLFLMSLEWQCHIENLAKRDTNNRSFIFLSDAEFDEEPVTKQPRLAESPSSSKSSSSDEHTPNEDEIDGVEEDLCIIRDDDDGDQLDSPNVPDDGLCLRELVDIVASEDTSDYTKSNRKAPNLATYYFRHIDTDSDMEKTEQLKENENENESQMAFDETSEDEWTYAAADKKVCKKNDGKGAKPPRENITWLVQKAEELVRDVPKKTTVPLNKITRVKEWLNMDKPEDSCDASGEDDEQESQTSEDFNESIVTYRAAAQGSISQNTSFIDLGVDNNSAKLVVRRAKFINDIRPWSVSCITQLSGSAGRISTGPSNFSISESALHHLQTARNFNDCLNTSSGQGNNSTSSTVEESSTLIMEEKYSPARRKRLKLKKCNNQYRRNCCPGSPYTPTPTKTRLGTLVKSGSFSGHSHVPSTSDRHSVSDPSALSICHYGAYESTTSGAESDDERKMKRLPAFKIGAKTTNYTTVDTRDNSPGKNSIIAAEEQSSSMSEQAWDSFQEEKYLSEPYSETHDSDAARKLLEFGEDYRNFLGSQSDWSTQSTNPGFSPPFVRRHLQPLDIYDSDSDVEDFRHLLKESRDKFVCTNELYKRQLEQGLNSYLLNADIKDVMDTCDRYIKSLVVKPPQDNAVLKTEVSELVSHWRNLKERVSTMHEYRELQKEILSLKDTLNTMKKPAPTDPIIVNSVDDLAGDIDFYSTELICMDEHKKKLLNLNIAVHRFITINKDYNSSFLKSYISELYHLWYDIHGSACDRIAQLKDLRQTWQLLETRLEQLRGDLSKDGRTLDVLDSALEGGSGSLSVQMAASIRDVDKLLSDTHMQGYKVPELFMEGSFSDSGISDEGSEHELGERAHRLTAIRRLVRQLEIMMSPNSEARIRMSERLNATEEDLKNLQTKCRALVTRTAATDNALQGGQVFLAVSDSGDPGEFPNGTSWIKRVTRMSIPFQIALMALICVACLLEPHCCDNMNTFSLSLTPHLHYVRGPPPV